MDTLQHLMAKAMSLCQEASHTRQLPMVESRTELVLSHIVGHFPGCRGHMSSTNGQLDPLINVYQGHNKLLIFW